jgi:DNA-binding CsgD family transcriptional regulator
MLNNDSACTKAPVTRDFSLLSRAALSTAMASTYLGPERRTVPTALHHWLTLMIDEIDYGMLLLTAQGQVVHANHLARVELDGNLALRLAGRELQARQPKDGTALRDAITAAAQRHRRCLLRLGEGAHKLMVSVVPLTHHDQSAPAIALVFGKRQVCEQLSVQSFARAHDLTNAETRVLSALCSGQRVREVARLNGVKESTVRSQVGSIRAKTGAESIPAVVRQVAVLPPLVSVLRSVPRTTDTAQAAW